MKLDRLTSTTQHLSPESSERARHVADESILRVGAMEGVEGDRQRSLQQELAEFDPQAVGAFDGGELIMAAAHDVAIQLSALGNAANSLVKMPDMRLLQAGIDAKA
jgi:hypothetical protein